MVSDANAVRNLLTHGFAADLTDAGARAVNAGVDLEMVISDAAYAHLPEALDSGATDVAAIDASVRRILEARAPRRSAEQDQREQAVTDPVVTAGPRLGVPAARRRGRARSTLPARPTLSNGSRTRASGPVRQPLGRDCATAVVAALLAILLLGTVSSGRLTAAGIGRSYQVRCEEPCNQAMAAQDGR